MIRRRARSPPQLFPISVYEAFTPRTLLHWETERESLKIFREISLSAALGSQTFTLPVWKP